MCSICMYKFIDAHVVVGGEFIAWVQKNFYAMLIWNSCRHFVVSNFVLGAHFKWLVTVRGVSASSSSQRISIVIFVSQFDLMKKKMTKELTRNKFFCLINLWFSIVDTFLIQTALIKWALEMALAMHQWTNTIGVW